MAQFFQKMVEHRPLPPVLQVTIDLTGEERNVEEYELRFPQFSILLG